MVVRLFAQRIGVGFETPDTLFAGRQPTEHWRWDDTTADDLQTIELPEAPDHSSISAAADETDECLHTHPNPAGLSFCPARIVERLSRQMLHRVNRISSRSLFCLWGTLDQESQPMHSGISFPRDMYMSVWCVSSHDAFSASHQPLQDKQRTKSQCVALCSEVCT